MNKKIYVSLASYRDPYLQSTIDSLFCESDFPNNIKVGCFIHALPEEMDTLKLERTYDGKVEYSIERAGQMFSVTECRNRSLAWLTDEYDYILQVDAHTRFDQGWDTYLINLIESIEYDKPILSGSLSTFDIKEDGEEVKTYMKSCRSFYMNNEDTKRAFLHSYDLAPNGHILPLIEGKNYAIDWYLAGHFIFAPAAYFKSIPQPDWVLFWGEEVINGVRAFTAGWNVYIPEDIPLYHLYSPVIKRPRLWEDFPDGFFSRRDYTSNRIVDIMINKNIQEGDLFYERSLEEFYNHVGCNLGELFDNWRTLRNEKIGQGRENELH